MGSDTKQKILEVSLSLFSQYGFTAVSIRDICKKINIKESSVYYHFKNKRAILESLQGQFEEIAAKFMEQLDGAIANPCDIKDISGAGISKIFFEDYLMDDFCNQFIRVLYIEQSNDEVLRQAYDKWIFDVPLKFQSKVFSTLIHQGVFCSANSGYLAVKFYSPILLYFQRYLLSGDLTKAKKDIFRQKANGHVLSFFKENGAL